MFFLDSDHMSLLQRGGTEGQRIWQRIRVLPPDDLAATIVTYEEQMRGWLARTAQATTTQRQISDYGELKKLLQDYCGIAAVEFDRLKQARVRIGTMDLKIAAITLANNATLLTRNSSDFGKVPELQIEDWSV